MTVWVSAQAQMTHYANPGPVSSDLMYLKYPAGVLTCLLYKLTFPLVI